MELGAKLGWVLKVSLCLSIVARKRQVVVLAIAISIVATVVSALALLQDVIANTQAVTERVLKPAWKLVPDPAGSIVECTGTLVLDNSTAHIPIIIVPGDHTLINIRKPRASNASIGYLIAEPGVGKTITVAIGGRKYKLEVGSVHHTNSGLDVSVIVWSNRISDCKGLHLLGEKASTQQYSRVLRRQLSSLVGDWRLSGVIILAVGSIIAGLKASSDLTRETTTLLEEGVPPRCLTLSLALVLALAAFTGYAWGWIVVGMADSATASVTGVFLPIPRVTLASLLEAGIAPALLVFALSLLTGEIYASHR